MMTSSYTSNIANITHLVFDKIWNSEFIYIPIQLKEYVNQSISLLVFLHFSILILHSLLFLSIFIQLLGLATMLNLLFFLIS
jgi:hypothetical protein